MTYEEACEILGVGRSTSEKDVRRAYAKLVKKHKPELDPEGFRRVRDAFERLQSQTIPALVVPWAPPEVLESPSSDEAWVAPLADPTSSDDVVRYIGLFEEALSRDATMEELSEIAVRAVDRFPRSAAAHELLVEAYELAGDEEAARRALRAAADLGLHRFLDALVLRAPELLRDDELDALGVRGSERARMAVAVLYAERGDVMRAVGIASRLLEEAERGEARVSDTTTLVRFGLLLYTTHELARAASFSRSLVTRLPNIGRARDGFDPVSLVYLRELEDLHGFVDDELLRIIARCVVAGGDITELLARFRPEDRGAAARALRIMTRELPKQAPTLAKIFGYFFADALDARGGSASPGSGPSQTWPVVIAFLLALRLLGGMTNACGPSSSRVSYEESDSVREALRERHDRDTWPALPAREDLVVDRIFPSCASASAPACTHASALAAHLNASRCPEARLEIAALALALGAPPPNPIFGSPEHPGLDAMSRHVLARCGADVPPFDVARSDAGAGTP